MAHSSKNKWVDYVVLGLSVFLIFCLLFESYIVLPSLVSWMGRWHPLVLHFPIVLLLMALFLGLTGKKVPYQLLTVAVLSALLTAISGFFLGKEVAVKGDLLFRHQWLGAGVALLAALWYALTQVQLSNNIYTKGLQVVLVGLVVATGHYGGMVTHGEGFLALPTKKRPIKIPENPIIYTDVVTRILENKCVSCHNPNKRKGELVMTSLAALLKGGESGNTLVPGLPEESELIRRLHLPMQDEEHMPPEGKTPLTQDEIGILERWISLGASDTLRLAEIKRTDPLVGYVEKMMQPDLTEKWIKLPMVQDSTLQNLASNYITIHRISSNSKGLSVSVYLPPEYDPKAITDLQRISKNIIELDLSGIPLGNKELDFVALCDNLEWLEIDRTPITDAEFTKLRGLTQLKMLKAYSTSISDESISVLKALKELKTLYVWDTQLSASGLAQLKESLPNLEINVGSNAELKAEVAKNGNNL
ncbi:c-type cytochrome domain-containing protein [Arenibacter lacus]|uniref:c-type cytochrome domain-containing protein n=1 Tax=Arenibacter lacus TaxID=2608629 RepID=UPI00123C8B3E|nr:c-type cytochrome domain-containing protein [Arenibacter lacus]